MRMDVVVALSYISWNQKFRNQGSEVDSSFIYILVDVVFTLNALGTNLCKL